MNRKQLSSVKKRARSDRYCHWYPDWVFHVREDITRRNMDLYDQQQEKIRSRCHEIAPDFNALPWIERMEVWTQARRDLGML